MLHRNFELTPIKIGFFTNFLSCSKIWRTIAQGISSKMAKRTFVSENVIKMENSLLHVCTI